MTPTDERIGQNGTLGRPPEETVKTLFQAAEAEALNWSGLTAPYEKRFLKAARSAVTAPFCRNNRPIE
jgi:hypothetical protein